MTHALLVSSNYYSMEELAEALEKRGVTTSRIYRDYHFDPSLKGVDVVVTDGTCKTRGGSDPFDDGRPYTISYHEPEDAAKRKHIPFVRVFYSYSGKTTPGWIIKWRARRIIAAISR